MPTVTIGENTADDHAGCEENHIQLFSPTVNNGAATVAEITKYGSGDWTHLLMKFTGLDSITGTVTVSSATLNIQQDEDAASSGHDDTITVRECYRAWSELQSTWNIFSTSNNWQTAGGIGAADRNNTTALGTFTTSTASTGTSGVYRSFTSAALAQWAEDVINGSISSANGLHFERTDSSNDTHYWRLQTSDHADTGERPYLEVVYTLDSSSSLLLLDQQANGGF